MSKALLFLKNHILGICITSILCGVAATYLHAWLTSDVLQEEQGIYSREGIISLTEFGEFQVNYGVEFKSPPKVEFFDYDYQFETPHTIGFVKLGSQSTTGFSYIVEGSFGHTTLKWVATGVRQN
ncbi:hypothetical protein HYO56_22760 [Vibrio parahaemolyticus]|nr:hypothetical protein [Vibrio parahaemolyticus]